MRSNWSAKLALPGALILVFGFAPIGAVESVDAAACVRISGGRFDSPGNDNYAANLNGEYIRIKNYCSSTKSLGSWRLHETEHTFTFPSTFRLGAGKTVTVYSGQGTNTSTRRYSGPWVWGRVEQQATRAGLSPQLGRHVAVQLVLVLAGCLFIRAWCSHSSRSSHSCSC